MQTLTITDLAKLLTLQTRGLYEKAIRKNWGFISDPESSAGRPKRLYLVDVLPDEIQIAWAQNLKDKKIAEEAVGWILRKKFPMASVWNGSARGLCLKAREILIDRWPELADIKPAPTSDITQADRVKEPRIEHNKKSKVALSSKDFEMVPLYDIQVSAGVGVENYLDYAPKYLAFRKDWLKQKVKGNTDKLVLVNVYGDSMEPTLSEDDILLVDLSQNTPRNGKVFVIRVDNQLLVKRFEVQINGNIALKSDNPRYNSQLLPKDDSVSIIGMAVWAGGSI